MAVVKPPDEPSPGKEPPKPEPPPTEEARRLIKEYADDLREIMKRLRRLLD
jgi:hypothetical protein